MNLVKKEKSSRIANKGPDSPSIKHFFDIKSIYIGVRGSRQQDGKVLWKPDKKCRTGGMWPIGSKVYPSEDQAAEAYDAHMFRELGHRAILNFDAETYAEREGAVRRARQQEQARQIRLRRMNEKEMSLQTESPLTVSLNKLPISNAPKKAMDMEME